MSKSPFFDQDYGHIYFLDTLQGQIVVSSHRPICLDAKSPKLLNLVREIFFIRPIIVINIKITIFGQNYGPIHFLDTFQGPIRLISYGPICSDTKSPKLFNLVKELFFSRPMIMIIIKITIFGKNYGQKIELLWCQSPLCCFHGYIIVTVIVAQDYHDHSSKYKLK